jgi:dienelactone hydrolase
MKQSRSLRLLGATAAAWGFCLVAGFVGAALAQSSSQDIAIPTFTPADYAAILDGSFTSKADQISGKLTLPEGASGKVPAVILMHGSGGIRQEIEHSVSAALLKAGIATLIVDSFKGRGISGTGGDQGKLTMAGTVMDSFQALKALRERPEIDGARIGIAGFSRGGVAAIFSGQTPLLQAALGDAPGYAAHAPVYPGCATQWDSVKPTAAPMHFFLGKDDNLTPAAKCERYASRIRDAGGKAEVTIYSNASHQFLFDSQRDIDRAANFAGCDLAIDDKGRSYYPRLGVSDAEGWSSFIRAVFKDCGKRGFTRGGTHESRTQALKDIADFFVSAFRS